MEPCVGIDSKAEMAEGLNWIEQQPWMRVNRRVLELLQHLVAQGLHRVWHKRSAAEGFPDRHRARQL